MKDFQNTVRFWSMVTAALAAVSCQMGETDIDGNGDPVGTQYKEIVLDAYQEEGETRTELSGTSVLWSPGDAVSILLGASASRLESTGTSASAGTTFSGSLAVDVSACHNGDAVWGVYPYSSDISLSGSYVTTTLPSVQTAKAGSFANNLMLLLGKTALTTANLSQSTVQLSMNFKNVCSGVRFKVTRSDIKTVTMTARGGQSLCGTVTLGMDGSGNPTIQSVTNGSPTIELQAPNGGTFATNTWYYFVTLPGTLGSGATFTVTTTTQTGSRNVGTSGFTLTRGQFSQIPDLDGSMTMQNLNVEVQVAGPDTWVAEDELGRAMPGLSEAGATKAHKHVVLFYSNWHCDSRLVEDNLQATQVNYSAIFNVETMKQKYAEKPDLFTNQNYWSGDGIHAPIDNGKFPYLMGYSYNQIIFWGTPLFGYYRTTDPWVLRKHAEMLADAGVDAVVFDCSNGHFLWEASVDAMIASWTQAKRDGVQAPKMIFMLNLVACEDAAISLRRLYAKYYSNPAYADMWFHLEGDTKPLVMAFPESLGNSGTDATIRSFFPFRPGQGDYVNGDRSQGDQWGWMQTFYGDGDIETFHDEEITVSVAQNARDASHGHCFAFNSPGTYGRSYTHANGHAQMNEAQRSYIHGYNFQEQWNNALAKTPPYVFVTGWNEWIAGMQYQWPDGTYAYGAWGPPAFADQFAWEHSRDCEPTLDWGDDGDNYYYQLARNIRMYKGVGAYPNVSAPETMTIDGDFTGWDRVSPDFKHYPGNTLHRAHQGHTEHELAFYRNNSGRNDIVDARVTRDADYVYFYVETAANITAYTDSRWMRLLINKDMNWSTGWKGYDYCLNFETPASPTQGYISQCSGTSWSWTRQGTFDYRVTGNKMELRIPRNLFPSGKLDFAFKWADNNLEEWGGARETRILNLYVDGDAAPGGRFNFHYVEP